jgi:sulfide dehydrogenase cytochrome subunit
MVRKVLIAACAASAVLISQPGFADTASGRMLGATCAGCHGTEGKAEGAIPSIYGTPKDQMISTMQAYKSGKRPGTIMNRIAKGYSDEEIQAMAEYFAGLK